MAEKDKSPSDSHADSNPGEQPPLATPVPESDDDSSLDFSNVASVRDGASGVIPLASLPDPTSSPSLVSWTEVIRQHRETAQNVADSPALPVTIDSVSDKDLLQVVAAEEVSRAKSPPVISEQDTDKLGKVPIVQGDLDLKSGSSIQLEGPGNGEAPQTPSNSAIQFNMKNVPSDAGGMIPNPWEERTPGAGGELDLDAPPAAEAVHHDRQRGHDDEDITQGSADPFNPTGQSSILDVLLENPRMDAGDQSPSEVVNYGNTADADGVPVPLDDLDFGPAGEFPLSSYPGVEAPAEQRVEPGSGWLTGANAAPKKRTDPAVHLPEDAEESVDLYADGPVSHGISDSGTLKIDEEELKNMERKKMIIESSAIDLSSNPTGFDLDIASAKSGHPQIADVESDNVDMALPEIEEAEGSQIRRMDELEDEAAALSSKLSQRKKAVKPTALPPGLEPVDEEIAPEPAPRRRGRKTQVADDEAAYPPPEVVEDDNVVVEEAEEKPKKKKSAAAKREARPAKKGGGLIIGALVGLLLGAGSVFGLVVGKVVDFNALVGGEEPVPAAKGGIVKPTAVQQPAAATPEQARRLFDAGEYAKAVEMYDKCDAENPAVLMGKGQAKWLGYLKATADAGKQLKGDAPEIAAARADFKAVIAKVKDNKSAQAQMEAARAYLWQGVIEESLGNFDKAEKIYDEASTSIGEAQRGILTTASSRLKALRPVPATPPVGMIDPRRMLFAFVLLTGDDPADPAPKGNELVGQESGFLFWDAMLLASQQKFGDAAKKIPAIKAVHARQQVKFAGKGLNPLSDPREQMLPACLDELERYWLLCEKLYQHGPKSEDLVRQKKTSEALDTVFESVKGATEAVDLIKNSFKLPPGAKSNEIAEAIKKELEGKKAAEQTLASIAKSLKDAGNEEPKAEEAVAKLIADKKGAEKQVTEASDKLKAAEEKLKEASAALAGSDAIVNGVRDRFVSANFLEKTAAKEMIFKAVEQAIERGKDGAAAKFSKERDDALAMAAKLAEELKESKSKFALELKESKNVTKEAAIQAEAKLQSQKKTYEETLSKVRSPAQVIDVWLPALSDRNRTVNFEQALKDVELTLDPGSGADAEAKAKALVVKALVLRNQGKLKDAQTAFTQARALPGFSKDKPWAKEAAEMLYLLKAESNDLAGAEDAAKKDPASAESQFVLASVLEKQGNLKDAAQKYRDVLKLKPEENLLHKAQLGLARVLLMILNGKPPAPKAPDAATSNAPPRDAISPDLLLAALVLFAAPEQPPSEIQETLQLADLLISQNEYLGYIIKADALAKLGRWNEALHNYSQGIKMLKVLPKEYAGVLDRILARHPDLQSPDRAPVKDESLALKFYAEGLENFRAQRPDEAQKDFMRAVKYNEDDARYWYFLGLSRWLQADKKVAETNFKKGAALEKIGKPDLRTVNSSFERVPVELRQLLRDFRP